VKTIWIAAASLVAISSSPLPHAVVQQPPCLHGSGETQPERVRRDGALRAAQRINTAQAKSQSEARKYLGIDGLPPEVRAVPEGFALTVVNDGRSYGIFIKDTLDQCGYAVVSDQEGVIYTASPARRGP
jgi:hypothetical protein